MNNPLVLMVPGAQYINIMVTCRSSGREDKKDEYEQAAMPRGDGRHGSTWRRNTSAGSSPAATHDPCDKEVNSDTPAGRGACTEQYTMQPSFPALPTAVPLTYTLTMHACLSTAPEERPTFEQVRPHAACMG